MKTFFDKVKRVLRKPPRFIIARVWYEIKAELGRFWEPQYSRWLTPAMLLRKLKSPSIEALWKELGAKAYCTQTQSIDRENYEIAKGHLLALRGTKDSLRLLLHGPGGSGKSTAIEFLVEYARDFCRLLEHTFTSRTILVSAMSGVAATLLMGETTHSVLGLCRKNITEDEIGIFSETRLIIIDEISFASREDFEKTDNRL